VVVVVEVVDDVVDDVDVVVDVAATEGSVTATVDGASASAAEQATTNNEIKIVAGPGNPRRGFTGSSRYRSS
jgi:hypothetical protein